MLRTIIKTIWLTSLFAVAVAATAQQPTTVSTDYVPPLVTISSDAAVIRNCASTTPAVVHLTASSSSVNASAMRYKWTTDSGHIDGSGPTVAWVLDGIAPGYYRANLEAFSGNTNEECQAFASTVVLIECPPSPCPRVTIACPERVSLAQPMSFSALVTGTLPSSPFAYNWKISNGTIVEGQGSSSITVSPSGLEGQSVTATVSLAGYQSDCSASCTVQLPIPQTCKKFDEFPEISRNDEKARLDNLAIELQSDPFATAYVTVHPATNGRPGDVEKRWRKVSDYLVNSRGLDSKRIVNKPGTTRGTSVIEIWTCPRGVTPH